MKTVQHSIKFETHFINEKDKTAKQLLSLSKHEQEVCLSDLAYSVLSDVIEKELVKLNKGNSFAILKLVK